MPVDGLRNPACGLKIRGFEPQADAVALQQRRGYRALDLSARRNTAGTQVVDLHLAASSSSTGPGDHQITLRQGIHLAVCALERGADQHTAFERLGIAHRRHVHIQRLAGPCKGWQLGGDQHCRHVFELQLRYCGGRQGDAELLQIICHALSGIGHLGGLVASAIKAHHQAKAVELVAAHTFHGSHLLDPAGLSRAAAQSAEQQTP